MAITSTLAGAAWLARNEAERQRVRAEAEAETARQTTRFMVDLFKVSDPSEALGNTITAREILDKGAARIDTRTGGPARDPGDADGHDGHGLHEPRPVRVGDAAGAPGVREAAASSGARSMPRSASSLNHLGEVLTLKSDYDEAETTPARGAGRSARQLFGERAPRSPTR